MRGYVHGGLFIDFVGEKTPVSVIRLLSLDVIILLIDIIMMGLVIERLKTTGATTPTRAGNSAISSETDTSRQQQQQQQQGQGQNHDLEERGILNTSAAGATTSAVDNQDTDDMAVNNTSSDVDERLERTELLAGSQEGGELSPGSSVDSHALDVFASGEAVIMDIGLISLIREQWRYKPSGPPRRAYLPSDETTSFLRERFGLQINADGRIVRVAQ